VRANLDSPGIAALRETAVQRCTGIPRAWPAVQATQTNVEKYVKRDQADTANCATASLEFIRSISGRDKALTGKKK